MFRIFSPSTKRPAVSTRRLALESLEARDCPTSFTPSQFLPLDLDAALQDEQVNGPASPYTIAVDHVYESGHNVTLTGTVTGTGAGGRTIQFQGPISGFTTTETDGSFSFTTEAEYLGNLFMAVIDTPEDSEAAVRSNVDLNILENLAPAIVNFAYERNGNWLTFTGTVTDEYASGLTVNFFGDLLSLQNQQVTVMLDNTFTLVIQMQGIEDLGSAFVQVYSDWWGMQSDYETTYVT